MNSKNVKWRRMTAVLLSMAMILVNGSQVFAETEGASSEPSASSAGSQTETSSEEEPAASSSSMEETTDSSSSADESSSEEPSSSEPGNGGSDASSSSSPEEDPDSSSSEEESSSTPPENEETGSSSSVPEPAAPEEEALPTEDSVVTGAFAAGPRANEYTVIFKDHDGTELGKFVIQDGNGFGTAPELKATPPAGATFAGWWDPAAKKGYDGSTPITQNVTLQAKYVSSFTVTFYKADGNVLKTETVQQNLEDTQTVSVPTADDPGNGAVFSGWSTNKDANYYDSTRVQAGATSILVTENSKYYPLYMHTITFNPNGGTLYGTSQNYTDGTTRGKPYPYFSSMTPSRVDTVTSQDDKDFVLERKFEFKGWKDINNKVELSSPVMANVTFTAQWETLSGTKYTVKLDKDGDPGTQDFFTATNVAEGAVIKSFPTLSQTNLTLKGWYTEPNGQGTKWEESTTAVTKNLTLYPFFDRVECRVNFIANNTQLTSVNAMQGETIANPNIEVPDFVEEIEFEGKGYPVTFQFIGKWAKGADGNSNYWDFEKDTVQENPTKVYAVYSAVPDPEIPQGVYDKIGAECSPENFVSVTFNPNNGASSTVRTLKKGERISPLNPPPEKEDYSLAFWSRYSNVKPTNTNYKFNFNTAVQQDTKLFAIWRKNAHVYFDTQGGNYIQWKSVPVGEMVTKPAEDPKRPGFRFVGWSEVPQKNQSSSKFTEYDFSKKITADSTGNGSDKTLYAWYASDTTVSFHYNFPDASSEKVTVMEIGEDQQLALPEYEPESSPAGKVFTGWYTDREGGEKCTAGLTSWPTATNLDVYAHWTDARYLQFDSQGCGTKTVALLPDATEVTIPDFGVWNSQYIRPDDWFTSLVTEESTRANFEAILKDAAFVVGTTRTVYAKWTPVSSGSLSVAFDANGGTFESGNKTIETVSNLTAGIGQIDVASNKIKAPVSSEQGIRFGGWYFDKECTQSVNAKEYNLVSDLTLYARWVYPVDFYYRGSADTADQLFGTQYAVKGAKVNSAGRPTIPDRTFQFWTENATGKSAVAWDFRENTVTAPVSLYAQCTAVVAYQAGTDASFEQPDLEKSTVWIGGDQTIARPKDPTRDGFRFKGWFLDENGAKPFAFRGESSPTSVNGNTVLYAVWETVPTHTVTFMKNDGSGASNKRTVTVNEPVSRPGDPETTGKTFMGWSTDRNAAKGFTAYDFETKVSSDLTLYAVWAVVVTFDPGENAQFVQPSADARTVWPGGDGFIDRPGDPLLDGSSFEGWVTESGDPFQFAGEAAPTAVTQNIRLIAKWSGKQYHLIANAEGNGNKGVRILGLDHKTFHTPGERIRLQVEIDPGYRFVSWKSNVDGIIENPTSTDTWLTMPARQTTIVAKAEKVKNERASENTEPLETSTRRRSTSDDGSSPAGTFFTAPTPRPAAQANPLIDNTGARGSVVEYSSTQISDIIRANQNNDVTFMYDTYQFIFPRGTMQAQSGISSYHFGVSIGAEGSAAQRIRRLTGRDDDVVVHYAHSGPLPTNSNVQIRLQIGQGLAGESFAYCFYNPQTDTLEKLEEVRADASGWVTVHQNHCSDYVLTRAAAKALEAVSPAKLNSRTSNTQGLAGRILSAEENTSAPELPGRIVQTAEVTVDAAEKSAVSAGPANVQRTAPEPGQTVERDSSVLAAVILLAGAFLITAGLLRKRLERGKNRK